MSVPSDVRSALETHLGQPVPGTALDILGVHLAALPPGLARAVGSSLSPRDRTRVPNIRRRRHLYATALPRPALLSAEQGRLRWPLLWERLGGDLRVLDATAAQREESAWAENQFMPGRERFVGRLGRMLAEEEEMREWADARAARARERRLDDVGEEFDDESDDEDPAESTTNAANNGSARAVNGTVPPRSADPGDDDQARVIDVFERRLLELFIDGLDTIDYDDVDFSEPPVDHIAERDAEDAWFDDEEPSRASASASRSSSVGMSGAATGGTAGVNGSTTTAVNGSSVNGGASGVNGVSNRRVNGTSVNGSSGRFASQNGQGEYDY